MENSEPNTLNKTNSEGIAKAKNLIVNVVENENQAEQSNLKLIKKA